MTMDIGMLWHDADPQRTLAVKLARAISYYESKYGQRPNTCFVHPATLPAGTAPVVSGLRLQAARTILPNHFWLGIETR